MYPEDGREFTARVRWENSQRRVSGLAILVSPSPFSKKMNLYIHASQAGEGSLRLQDSRGLVQVQQPLHLSAGDNAYGIQTNIPPGVYFVVVESGGERIVKQVLKI